MHITADMQRDLEACAVGILKRTTGRGPKVVQLEVLPGEVRFRFKGVLSCLEETLLVAFQQRQVVRQIRELLVQSWRFG